MPLFLFRQTIALLAHLACSKGEWGPHLIVVPTSVMLNWEMEIKKWCPAFKVLTYYGSQKERRLKRVGWTKPNAFHVCITSYKLVVQVENGTHTSCDCATCLRLAISNSYDIKGFFCLSAFENISSPPYCVLLMRRRPNFLFYPCGVQNKVQNAFFQL